MKKLLLIFFLLPISFLSKGQTSTLKSNAQIIISAQNGLHSNGIEQPFFIVVNDIKDDSGRIMIQQGTSVNVNVVRQPAKAWGKPGFLSITPLDVSAVDGQLINLSGNFSQQGEDRATIAWAVAGGGCLLFLGVGVLLGFVVKGGEAELPQQYLMLNVRTTAETKIKVKINPDK